MSTNLATKIETMATLTVVYSAKPFYYVEEATIEGKNVSVSYFDENIEEWDTVTSKVPVKALLEFVNEFYRVAEETDNRSDFEYLQDNLEAVVRDYLNHGKGVSHV
ncbi:hypothetical protein [Mucilaginibacter xinganensis]|uniref:Uncharacterized protein n=1 Tax=Mucilaginibacter xinganensis TaxID=1234841 RepID=A0A223NWW9_9SPHI|nr:hypothetical protein [Mucilaginibacter xinganensis]ASU34355.1 hypothetical protein MuYL_2468 [Mucilaginibacter xinganensis]